jgi:hypothetical protein
MLLVSVLLADTAATVCQTAALRQHAQYTMLLLLLLLAMCKLPLIYSTSMLLAISQ